MSFRVCFTLLIRDMSVNKTFKKTEAIGNTALLLEENKAYSRAAFASIFAQECVNYSGKSHKLIFTPRIFASAISTKSLCLYLNLTLKPMVPY